MATPAYNAAWRSRAGYGQHTGYGSRSRTWGIVAGNGSMLGGNTPQYLGGGQPAAEDSGSIFGNGTPDYRSAPTPATSSTVTPQSTAASDAPQPPGPQPGQVVVVVPRS